MIVIFPADELLLMTYGAAAIPRISPRPTLDCLREPKVPIVYPAHFKTAEKNSSNSYTIANHIGYQKQLQEIESTEPEPEFELEAASAYQTATDQPSVSITAYAYDINTTPQALPAQNLGVYNSLPPTPPRQTPRSSLKRSIPITTRRGSTRNTTLPAPPTAAEPNIPSTVKFNYEYPIMQPQYSSESGSGGASMGRGVLERSGGGLGGLTGYDYHTRSRSPSIMIEPATPAEITDPTQPIFGPGWGRPMSPMDLPPEPSKSPTGSRSRLRPKIHIPRLGRSSSSEHRESNRLKEDLHLQVENPIFNSENLRQRNFDAFFESGEPVYKLHPTTPASAPADSSSLSNYSPLALDKYAGVYNSSPRGRGTSSGGGLFAKTPNESKAANSRSKSVEKFEAASRSVRAASVSADGGGGVPQKGDRCPKNTILRTLINLFTVFGF